MKWNKWKIGFVIAVFCGLLSAGASLVDGMHWKTFVAVLCTSLLTNLLTYLKDHPIDAISDTSFISKDDVGKVGLIALCLFSPLAFQGCDTPIPVVAYQTEGAVITTADAAMKAYADYSQTHTPSKAEYERVKEAWDTYYNAQQVAKLALEAYMANSSQDKATEWQKASANVAAAQIAVIELVKGILK